MRAQPRRRRCAALVRAERGHRRHGLRPARPRPRDGASLGRPHRPRRECAAGAPRARSSSRGRACAPAATAGTASSPAAHVTSSASPELEALAYDPQTAGGLLVTLPAEKRAVLEATFAGGGLAAPPRRSRRGGQRRVARAVRLRERLRGPVPPVRFVRIATGSVVALGLVVTSGAFVRLTGSGLGCDNWPRCGDTPFPAKDFHAMVEFGNRVVALVGILAALVTWLASRRVEGLDRWVRLTSLAAFLGTVAQIPLGGITVILDLHPARGDVPLPARAGRGRARGRRRARGMGPRARPRARRSRPAGCGSWRWSASPLAR